MNRRPDQAPKRPTPTPGELEGFMSMDDHRSEPGEDQAMSTGADL